MLTTVIQHILLIFFILVLVMIAQKLKIAYPIILVLGGLGLSMLRLFPSIEINPELILLIFLPPLLYEAAWYTSWKELWRWRRVISIFAFLIVIVTSGVVAVVSHALIPGFSLALGFVLGGIVSPPDAVSATTILKYVKVPKRISAILEGESLMNDASSLIVFTFARTAVTTGVFVLHEAATGFVVAIVMGIAIGLLVALLYYAVHRWLPTGTEMDVILTLTAPYVMYITAEYFHGSGVLAVVSGGLFLSSRSQHILSYRSRLQGANVWATLGFMLNGLVFMLIGLELPVIIKELGTVSLSEAIKYGVIITVVLIVTRLLCTLSASAFTVFISRYITTADSRPGWKGPVIIGWAGMRGVVSLAAALSIPVYMDNGALFPQRNLILFITFTVILLTLVAQGLSLPFVIKWVNMEDPDKHLPVEEQERIIRDRLLEGSIRFLDNHYPEEVKANPALKQLREDLEHRKTVSMHNKIEGVDHLLYKKVYLKMLNHQRSVLHELNKDPATAHELIRKYHELVDIEEEILRMKYEPAS
ncbi:Na+/H+ antiporter [Chitinophaga ginsengisegetis]|uniref:Na+/H+ antiporter n=1 Tax=Chitinophaga ginsengisegetis TaxID=393003 RepID=UPI000DBA1F0D|nr:Na+/H+ antiporter [Chitinophaga ginsengisegetis]MDR6568315.1 CPA1 family monovalent cation:H+ antiporter [Chitinophaga ginsengisegetis]MDR6648454.1 CPA1 family monovalent cation:H+ antiporter [Chitinophaga ginsengisegetis]MDR6654396.1 CPA1 family monovalent cation:H+ antiporter [Chitinophaga ginsengisegetis]